MASGDLKPGTGDAYCARAPRPQSFIMLFYRGGLLTPGNDRTAFMDETRHTGMGTFWFYMSFLCTDCRRLFNSGN